MLLIKNIRSLVHTEEQPVNRYHGDRMNTVQTIDRAYMLVDGERISAFGMQDNSILNEILKKFPRIREYDAGNRLLLPGFCDAHTHLVWAGQRVQEFNDRLNGMSYEAIAAQGGGILNSASKLRMTSPDELMENALMRLDEIRSTGTVAVEIKSGYGLDLESELKILRVIRELKSRTSISIRPTFLGAHAVPPEYKNNKEGYLQLLIHEMIPAIAAERLADYCDIFCEQNYFSYEDAMRLFEAANKHGLRPKVHAEQLSNSGGIRAGVESDAISVDHLEFASEADIQLLKASATIPVLLPGAQLFLGLQNPPARKMLEAGLPVALSSDFNPGSCPSGNMQQMLALACILYKMTPAEALIACTTNSAAAMDLSDEYGSIAVGKKASFIFTPAHYETFSFIPYYFGSNGAQTVILNGKIE